MAEAKKVAKKGGKEPFCTQSQLKDVFPLFQDRKTKLLPLNDVPYVLRACGLTIYGEEEVKIKGEVEKVDGMGKPVSFQTLQDWMSENATNYQRSYDDAYNALNTLCYQGLIAEEKTTVVRIAHLRHLVGEVGDKIPADTFNKILKADDTIKSDTVPLDEFISFLQK
mmetsp:Transcript_45969/g.147792  ORF Transcript_45969/g.147792 Transcript_45969/m.147792 type:complete len:167 (-) Transcript_45969:223-723(-)